jgi:hypothetical protein
MLRWMFRIVAGLSLVLCLATCVLWVRSFATATEFGFKKLVADSSSWNGSRCRLYYLTSNRPGISYTVTHAWSYGRMGWHIYHIEYPSRQSVNGPPNVSFLGFKYRAWGEPSFNDQYLREWMIPYWALMLVLACLPALAIRKALRSRRRRQPGLCPACGYDLRATPGRCPECGAVSA